MAKNPKRLTRADKINLSKLTDDFKSARDIGADESSLQNLSLHGLARSVLEAGVMTFRITQEGSNFGTKKTADRA